MPNEFDDVTSWTSLVKPLVDYLNMRAELGDGFEIPCFDPLDGGVRAKALFLLEAAGPKAVSTNFISRNNPDQTARNMCDLTKTAGIARTDTLLWNVVPWYVGEQGRIRPVNDDDPHAALPYLPKLISFLPDLKVVALIGRKARQAEDVIRAVTEVPIICTNHMSPGVFNVWKDKRAETQEAFNCVAALVGSRLENPLGH